MFLKLIFVTSLAFAASDANVSDKSLTEQLRERAENSASKSPQEVKKVMTQAIEDLRKSQILKKALKKGDSMPHFELPDVKFGLVSSEDLLKKGPLVIVFYRGGWCPYCNLQLHDLQKHLQKIRTLGAELVAISPESPDNSRETFKKQKLGFYVLSDLSFDVGRKFGLVFKLPDDLIELYKKFGIDLARVNANKKWELPLAATYVVSKEGKILYSFLDVDYKKRAETSEIIKILESL